MDYYYFIGIHQLDQDFSLESKKFPLKNHVDDFGSFSYKREEFIESYLEKRFNEDGWKHTEDWVVCFDSNFPDDIFDALSLSEEQINSYDEESSAKVSNYPFAIKSSHPQMMIFITAAFGIGYDRIYFNDDFKEISVDDFKAQMIKMNEEAKDRSNGTFILSFERCDIQDIDEDGEWV
tara:strand:+ start:69 stop:602 length:534 start_codon:yes stop_codon:yes gene_type:complete